jgi:hypothetical protein
LSGCSQEDPNPELKDPIYTDLSKRAADYQKQADDATVKVKNLRESLDNAEPNTIDVKDIRKDLLKTQVELTGTSQLAHYYKIRADRRKVVDKIEYRKALQSKAVWPDPHEYSDYLVNIRLNEIDLNWGKRVPKLQDRISKYNDPKRETASKPKEGGE